MKFPSGCPGLSVTLAGLLIAVCSTVSTGQDSSASKPLSADAQAPKAPVMRDPAMEKIVDDPSLPRVLIIGDSISIGYTVPLREVLAGKANLHRALTNCGPSSRGVAQLDNWLKTGGDKPWDVIQFNFGLHDIRYFRDAENKVSSAAGVGHRQVVEAEYEKNLRDIVKRLKGTGAHLIWRNTTPVPEGAKGRVPGEEVRYNDIARKIMEENNIEIDDLYSFCVPRLSDIQLPRDVHFKPEGSKALAAETAKKIIAALPAKK